MDTLTRTLIIEIAKTALRVLDAESLNPALWTREMQDEAARKWAAAQPTPWGTATNTVADKGTPKQQAQLTTQELVDKLKTPSAGPVLGREAGMAQRGDTVRFWDGNRYSIGTVQNICRKKVGQPASVTVRVERGEGRKGKTHKIEAAKAEVLRGVANV